VSTAASILAVLGAALIVALLAAAIALGRAWRGLAAVRPLPIPPPGPVREAQRLAADVAARVRAERRARTFETAIDRARGAPGAADFLLASSALATARRDILEDELRAVIAVCGGLRQGWRPGEAQRLQLSEETLAALMWVVAADPRIERIRIAETPEARRLIAAIKILKDIA
jgi:hypothetical protein